MELALLIIVGLAPQAQLWESENRQHISEAGCGPGAIWLFFSGTSKVQVTLAPPSWGNRLLIPDQEQIRMEVELLQKLKSSLRFKTHLGMMFL